jgi:cell wall-associated NlpC family hydrolase
MLASLAQTIKQYPVVLELLAIVGVRYSYGAGTLPEVKRIDVYDLETLPGGSKGGKGIDCSALAQWGLVVTGGVKDKAWNDLSAHDLANVCEAIDPRDAEPGDMYFYKNANSSRIHHVTTALGNELCLHASGRSSTNGDDPGRTVQVVHYTRGGNFFVAGRLKKKYRT